MFGLRSRKNTAAPPAEPNEQQLHLGYLGKIPECDDFIEFNARFREVQELDACLKQWYLDTHRQGKDARKAYRHFGFITTGGHDRQSLAGHVHSSTDRHGRAYPIIHFARWSLTTMYFRPAVLFHATQRALPAWHTSEPSRSETPDLAFLDRIAQNNAQSDRLISDNPVVDAMSSLATETLQNWLEAVTEQEANQWSTWLQTRINDIDNYVYSIKNAVDFTLKLPIGASNKIEISILFWLHILEGSFQGQHWRPDIIWTDNPDKNFLYILSKPLTTSQINQIFCDNMPDGIDHEIVSKDVATATTVRRTSELILKDSVKSLLDIAIRWSRSG